MALQSPGVKIALVLGLLLHGRPASSSVLAQEMNWGGSVRGYQFLRVEDVLPEQLFPVRPSRKDTELWLLRLEVESSLGAAISLEAQPLLEFSSPSLSTATGLATAPAAGYLPLEHDFTDSERVDLRLGLDRLNMTIHWQGTRLVLGRQAIGWGVNVFWPSLDLFSPFAPQRVDRDYKPGIDAIRVTLPIGSYSELDVVSAVLGSSFERDGSAAALLRLYLGPVDVGFMGGRFHRDSVAGGFFSADFSGTGLRGEINWTQSGDRADRDRDRRVFWRGGLGVDRQITPTVSISTEFFWNGYGINDASGYLQLGLSDRILRGEVNALGRHYLGFSTSWQFHALGRINNALLLNLGDPSGLWIPNLNWSTGNNSELLLGIQLGLGSELNPEGLPASEYGLVAATLFVGLQFYF